MKTLGLIPARSGSKGVPGKNIRPLSGRSLLERSFAAARDSGVLDRIILSTDSHRIISEADRIGLEAPFTRPSHLAADDSPMVDVALHAIQQLHEIDGFHADILVLLQPTSPLRTVDHIRKAVGMLGENDSVCTVVPLPKTMCPHYVMKITEDGFLDYFLPEGASLKRRQDVPQAYRRDGTVFVTRVSVIQKYRNFYGKKCIPFLLDKKESLSIDTPADWNKAGAILSGDTFGSDSHFSGFAE